MKTYLVLFLKHLSFKWKGKIGKMNKCPMKTWVGWQQVCLSYPVFVLKLLYLLATLTPSGHRCKLRFWLLLGSQIPKTVMILSKRNVFGTKGKMGIDFMILVLTLSWFCLTTICVSATKQAYPPTPQPNQNLRFDQNGEFKILQVADMHYANGKTTHCLNVLPSQNFSCSDLNTTIFLNRMIKAEKPNLIVFTGIPYLSCF